MAKTKEEIRAYQREWSKRKYAENPELYREKLRKYREENRASVNAKSREYREKNKGSIKETRKRSYEKHKERRLAEARQWKANNKEKVEKSRKEYYEAHKEKEKKTNRLWITKNKEYWDVKKKLLDKEWREQNKESISEKIKTTAHRKKINLWQRNRYRNDEQYRILCCLRASFRQALRLQSVGKQKSVVSLIGCSVADLVKHLEATSSLKASDCGVHIDHIRPCASFDLREVGQQKQCFHYSNLRLVLAKENLKKSSIWQGFRYIKGRPVKHIDIEQFSTTK